MHTNTVKSLILITLAVLVCSNEAYVLSNKSESVWGYCEYKQPVDRWPRFNDVIKFKILDEKVKNDDDEMVYNKIGSIACTDSNIADAGSVDAFGRYDGYPGGQCQFVRDNEACEMESMVNWIELYYCGFQASFCENGKSVIMLPVAVIAIVIAMYNLGSTADSYLSPALEAVSDKFMCSESLAGVTLLALGNGAPDVFAAIAAGGDEDGLNLQVSSLIGSSFFIVCVVMGLVLNSAPQKTIQVTRNFFIRDVTFMLITCMYLLFIMLILQKFNIGVSIGFLAIYVIFVSVVMIQAKWFNKVPEEEEEIAEQSRMAVDYTHMIAFKRQEFKKAKDLYTDTQTVGNDNSIGLKKQPTSKMFKSMYSKKVPKDLFDMDDGLSTKFLQGNENMQSRDFKFKKKRTMNFLSIAEAEDLDESDAKSRTHSTHNYDPKDVIQVPGQKQAPEISVEGVADKQEKKSGHFAAADIKEGDADDLQAQIKLKLEDNIEAKVMEYRASKQGSVNVLHQEGGPNLQASHVYDQERVFKAPEQNFAAQLLKMQFKRQGSGDSKLDLCWKVVEVPLNFLRDYSIPMAEFEEWDRNRASLLPLTVPISFAFLYEYLNDEDTRDLTLLVLAIMAGPGLIFCIYIQFCTKKTSPPPNIMFFYAILGFVMSIVWIGFTSDFVVDLLWILGLIFGLPKSLLGLTLLAVGNCLGDMNANVAMTKKGFGEMAITGCLAGPVFNVLFGLGLSTLFAFLALDPSREKVFYWSLWEKENPTQIDEGSILPLALIVALSVTLLLVLVNGIVNKFRLVFSWHVVSLIFYAAVVVGLCVFVVVRGVE